MNDVYINKVVVIKEFPGFELYDVLFLNPTTGLFEYLYNNTEETDMKDENTSSAVDAVFNELAKYKPSLSKEHILNHIDFFENISEYEMKDITWIKNRIEEIHGYIRKMIEEESEGNLQDTVNVKEANTVWQNVIWELETILGKRNPYKSDIRI